MQTQELKPEPKVYGGMRNMPIENKHLSIIVSSRLTSNPPAFITDKIGMVNPQPTGDSLRLPLPGTVDVILDVLACGYGKPTYQIHDISNPEKPVVVVEQVEFPFAMVDLYASPPPKMFALAVSLEGHPGFPVTGADLHGVVAKVAMCGMQERDHILTSKGVDKALYLKQLFGDYEVYKKRPYFLANMHWGTLFDSLYPDEAIDYLTRVF